ncbi:MAG: exodeoxyribonuclease III [Candidatus Methylacidiphilales bacterium]
MKMISWNVNGIRACLQKGFLEFIQREDPDIFCLQETKARREQVEMGLEHLYHDFWTSAEKPGYSGVAIYSKEPPLQVTAGLGIKEHDKEGRVLTAEYPDFYLVNVYTPNSKEELKRLAYRQIQWDPAFRMHLLNLQKSKPVICCGDLNVAHQEIDIARPKENERTAGFTREERDGMDNLVIRDGFLDTFRLFQRGGGYYTWWSFRANARARNIGWRIDYFLASPALKDQITRAWIMPEVLGSDHCPVGLELMR